MGMPPSQGGYPPQAGLGRPGGMPPSQGYPPQAGMGGAGGMGSGGMPPSQGDSYPPPCTGHSGPGGMGPGGMPSGGYRPPQPGMAPGAAPNIGAPGMSGMGAPGMGAPGMGAPSMPGMPPMGMPPSPESPHEIPVSALPVGHRILLTSRATGRNVRIHGDGRIDALGEQGPRAQFEVAPSTNGMLRLQNVENPNFFLSIHNGRVWGGEGGPHCEFQAFVVGPNVFALRSARDSNHGLGFHGDGNPIPPFEVKFGEHGQFSITSVN